MNSHIGWNVPCNKCSQLITPTTSWVFSLKRWLKYTEVLKGVDRQKVTIRLTGGTSKIWETLDHITSS